MRIRTPKGDSDKYINLKDGLEQLKVRSKSKSKTKKRSQNVANSADVLSFDEDKKSGPTSRIPTYTSISNKEGSKKNYKYQSVQDSSPPSRRITENDKQQDFLDRFKKVTLTSLPTPLRAALVPHPSFIYTTSLPITGHQQTRDQAREDEQRDQALRD